jgi:hypothetical protein
LAALVFVGCGSSGNGASAARPPAGLTPIGEPVPIATASSSPSHAAPSGSASAGSPRTAHPVFPPAPIEPPEAVSKRDADGKWTLLPAGGIEPSPFAMTVIHPHPTSPLIELAIAAIDLSRVELHLNPGKDEPQSSEVDAKDRSGLVPADEIGRLVALTNGGFKARHGNHGMKIGDVEFLPPIDGSCTLAVTRSGEVKIASWSRLAPEAADIAWFRQGAPCLVEDGAVGPQVSQPFDVRVWGASQEGDRAIRRSAYALSSDPRILYFAIGNQVDPQLFASALAKLGMKAACQFDINYSYVRFVTFERNAAGDLVASNNLMKDLKYTKGEGLKFGSSRDFFYFLAR